jgi:hypothetical protein
MKMKKVLFLLVIIVCVIVYAKFRGSGDSTGKNQSSPASTQTAGQNNPPLVEKKYTLDQIKLTDADGVKIVFEMGEVDINNLKDRDNFINSLGGLIPSVYYVHTLSINGINGSVSYMEFPNSTNAASAYQKMTLKYDQLVRSDPRVRKKAARFGNYVVGITSLNNEIIDKLVSILIQKTR